MSGSDLGKAIPEPGGPDRNPMQHTSQKALIRSGTLFKIPQTPAPIRAGRWGNRDYRKACYYCTAGTTRLNQEDKQAFTSRSVSGVTSSSNLTRQTPPCSAAGLD
ncbi:hypothetical protein PGTUg99_012839 [Puccinia graminis f. sp. tritici]|uniref:Uncharacterized protein n=2 Tax=Puccinia graminis f. sp. tritici TaxID=56615 RepID=E3K8R2_PUCGT|nr:uncharacterized protein PGTG_06742 [Puccinia graminis f. sp. tritici CRL 75-36-700-3]EFP80786.2 hypothetical protein PGTG_06742 [Puccinia graminis f. sp. tritici CRL 75-36-700-3]KAA1129481.1 hypothetical protein PGTUg99_012839 [Puccinia graminis f. sp. tritici]